MTNPRPDPLNHAALKGRIAGLMRMTIENGCSEAEAASAASKISDLLDLYGLTATDVEAHINNPANQTNIGPANFGDKARLHDAWRVAKSVADLFDCMIWQTTARDANGVGKRLVFFGYPQDTEAATALMAVIQAAMEREWKAWYDPSNKADATKHGRVYRAGFMGGMAERLNARLRALKVERNAKAVTTGTSLVILKGQVVARALRDTNIKLGRAGSRRSSAGDAGARDAGRAAGDRVNFSGGRAVSQTRKIGA